MKVRFDQKFDTADPQLADEARLVSVSVNWRDRSFSLCVAYVDVDDPDGPRIVAEKPVHIGFADAEGMYDIDALETAMLQIAIDSGALKLPAGVTIETETKEIPIETVEAVVRDPDPGPGEVI